MFRRYRLCAICQSHTTDEGKVCPQCLKAWAGHEDEAWYREALILSDAQSRIYQKKKKREAPLSLVKE